MCLLNIFLSIITVMYFVFNCVNSTFSSYSLFFLLFISRILRSASFLVLCETEIAVMASKCMQRSTVMNIHSCVDKRRPNIYRVEWHLYLDYQQVSKYPSHIEENNSMTVKSDHCSKFSNLSNWKEASTGFEPMTSANTSAMSYEATHWERGQIINFKTTL